MARPLGDTPECQGAWVVGKAWWGAVRSGRRREVRGTWQRLSVVEFEEQRRGPAGKNKHSVSVYRMRGAALSTLCMNSLNPFQMPGPGVPPPSFPLTGE